MDAIVSSIEKTPQRVMVLTVASERVPRKIEGKKTTLL